MTDAPAPAGSPEQLLLEALARHYGPAEFSARGAAAAIPGTLWQAAGVARPDPAAVGRWLRVRKGVVAGHVLANRKNRDGVALWRLRPVEPRKPDVPTETSRASPDPRVPAPGRVSAETSEVPTSARLPEPSAPPLAPPWWARSSFRPVPGGWRGRGTPARGHVVVARRGAP